MVQQQHHAVNTSDPPSMRMLKICGITIAQTSLKLQTSQQPWIMEEGPIFIAKAEISRQGAAADMWL